VFLYIHIEDITV